MPFKRGQLQKFVTVAEEGQITRAATKLKLAQPALSRAITQLESELGLPLLERHGRSVTLTPAGAAFLPKARVALAAHAEAVLTARSLARSGAGTIELGFLGAPPTAHVPELFQAFAALHPGVDVLFRELPFPSGTTASWISDVDVALCHPPEPPPDVHVQRVRAEARVLIAPRAHPLTRRGELSVAEVLDETFLGYDVSVDPRWTAFWNLDDHRGAPARLSVDRVKTPIEMLAALASGNAVTTVPACHAEAIGNALPGLVPISLGGAATADLSLVWSAESQNQWVEDLAALAAEHARIDPARTIKAP